MFDVLRKNFVRWIFYRHKKEIEDLFIADLFGDIPHDLTENSMKFLLSGGTNFDRWMRLSSYMFQRKLQAPLKESQRGIYIGGLVFFKTLNVMMNRLEHGRPAMSPENVPTPPPETTLEESLKGVDEFVNDKFFTERSPKE